MSRLEQLIEELCPDGVLHKPISQVGTFIRGGGPQKKDFTDAGIGCIHYGQIYTHYGISAVETNVFVSDDVALKSRKANPRDVIIAVTSENDEDLGKSVAWLGETPVAVSNHTLILTSELEPRFISYFLSSRSFHRQKQRFITGTKVRALPESAFGKIFIPVPPLPVQQEIVRMLDMFTQLEAELEAELEARKIQYAFYNDQILTFSEDVPFVPLDFVILDLRTGLNPRTNFKLNTFDACNYYITVRELAGFSVRTTEKTDQVNDEGLALIQRRARLREGDVLFSGTGTIGRTALVHSQPTDWNIKEGVYALTPNPELITSRFLIHILRSDRIRRRILASADGSTVSSVSMASLRRVKIPLPPREIQDSVVRLLDNFELLINDLSCGLPAEIAARRKQYEFYRDKLLSFKELSA